MSGKILVTGAAGQLGSAICSLLAKDYEVVPATRDELDITDLTATRAFIHRTKPVVVAHPAAYTDVDGCETNKDEAFLVNATGTRNVAIACREVEAKTVFISTDYVFDGEKDSPYVESDRANPLNVYGKSKLAGEEMVAKENPRSFILRVSWLYGSHGKNFVTKMLSLAATKDKLQVVNDQRGTPTFAVDVARQIRALMQTDAYGLYHGTAQGSCSWYEFALEILKNAGYEAEVDPSGSVRLTPNRKSVIPVLSSLNSNPQPLRTITLTPVTSEDFPSPARRPKNSVLDNLMLRKLGLDVMPPWQEALGKFMGTSEK